jgi:hypothetical protein
MPEALSDTGSAEREGRAHEMLVRFFYIGITFGAAEAKG